MNIHPIHNERDALVAAQQIEFLWDAAQGTPEAEELEILHALLEGFRLKRGPAPVPALLQTHHDLLAGLADLRVARDYLTEALKDADTDVYLLALGEVAAAHHS